MKDLRSRATMAARSMRLLHADVARLIGQAQLTGAPTGVHAEGRTLQNGLDAMDLAALHLEELRDLPGPRLDRPGHDVASVRRLEVPGVAALVIKESEGEDDAALLVHGDIAPVPDAADEVQQSGLELLHAAPLRGVVRGGLRVRARL